MVSIPPKLMSEDWPFRQFPILAKNKTTKPEPNIKHLIKLFEDLAKQGDVKPVKSTYRPSDVNFRQNKPSEEYLSMMEYSPEIIEIIDALATNPVMLGKAFQIKNLIKRGEWNELLTVDTVDEKEKMLKIEMLSLITLLAYQKGWITQDEGTTALRFYEVLMTPELKFKVVPAQHRFKDIPENLAVEMTFEVSTKLLNNPITNVVKYINNTLLPRLNYEEPITNKKIEIFQNSSQPGIIKFPSTPLLQRHLNESSEFINLARIKRGLEPLPMQIIKPKIGISTRKGLFEDLKKNPPESHFGIMIPGFHNQVPHGFLNLIGWGSTIHDFVHIYFRAKNLTPPELLLADNLEKWLEEREVDSEKFIQHPGSGEPLFKEDSDMKTIKSWVMDIAIATILDATTSKYTRINKDDFSESDLKKLLLDITNSYVNFNITDLEEADPIFAFAGNKTKFFGPICAEVAKDYFSKFRMSSTIE